MQAYVDHLGSSLVFKVTCSMLENKSFHIDLLLLLCLSKRYNSVYLWHLHWLCCCLERILVHCSGLLLLLPLPVVIAAASGPSIVVLTAPGCAPRSGSNSNTSKWPYQYG